MSDEDQPNAKSGAALGLGLVGAAFASLLALASVSVLSEAAKRATDMFAVSIPLSFAAYAFEILTTRLKIPWIRTTRAILLALVFNIAQISTAIGVYWLFQHIYPHAADIFEKSAIACYFCASVVGVTFRAIEGEYKRREKHHSKKSDTETSG